MGCDIHFIVEEKIDNKWVGILATDKIVYNLRPAGVHRNYEFFASLAGVRKEVGDSEEPYPKGLPGDVSELAILCIDESNGDAHSHSYCSGKEFCELFKKTSLFIEKKEEKDILGVYVKEFEDCRFPASEDLRIIYYFDN